MKKSHIIYGLLIVFEILFLVFAKFILVKTRDVSFSSGDIQLVGTIATPRFQSGPFPGIVVVHGSGTATRKEYRGYWRLISKGIAVLTYDKRGVGESGGSYSPMSMTNAESLMHALAGDAAAAVDVLKNQPEIDPNRLGLLGGSQAGWVMPIAANKNPDISFIVSISGPAVTFGQEDYYSKLTGDDPGFFSGLADAQIDSMLADYTGRAGYDPRLVLEKVKVPSFWILGEKDRSVPTKNTVAVLEEIKGDSDLITIKVYPGGDHSIIHHQTGSRINYWKDVYSWLEGIGIWPK